MSYLPSKKDTSQEWYTHKNGERRGYSTLSKISDCGKQCDKDGLYLGDGDSKQHRDSENHECWNCNDWPSDPKKTAECSENHSQEEIPYLPTSGFWSESVDGPQIAVFAINDGYASESGETA